MHTVQVFGTNSKSFNAKSIFRFYKCPDVFYVPFKISKATKRYAQPLRAINTLTITKKNH